MKTDNATARPWEVIESENKDRCFYSIVMKNDTGRTICDVYGDSVKQVKANATHIVRAVNNSDMLITALESILFCVGDDPSRADVHDLAYTALAKAKKGG